MTDQLQFEYIPTAALIPYARNARKHTKKQLQQIAASISEFGFLNPVIIDESLNIIAGHGRVLAAQKMKLTEVPTVQASHLTDVQRKAYVIADNKLAELAGWDEKLLALELGELAELPDFDVTLTGFTIDEIGGLLDIAKLAYFQGLTEPDEVPNIPIIPTSEAGDIWILGNHRVMCGNATDASDVEQLMAGDRADLIYTDPPYGVSYKGSKAPDGHEWQIIKNDELRSDGLYMLLQASFEQMSRHSKKNPAVYIWHASRNQMIFESALNDCGFEVKNQLIWNKGMVLGRSDYHWSHEPFFYCRKTGNNNEWYGDRKHKTIQRQDKIDFSKFRKTQLVAMLQAASEGSTVWEITKDKVKSYLHPTQKPVDLCTRAIMNSTIDHEIVMDLFGGSGSTIIGCEQTRRHGRMMELDPQYADVIVQRWQDYTGSDATLEGDGRTFYAISQDRPGTEVAA